MWMAWAFEKVANGNIPVVAFLLSALCTAHISSEYGHGLLKK
jgi:hypothetical protein